MCKAGRFSTLTLTTLGALAVVCAQIAMGGSKGSFVNTAGFGKAVNGMSQGSNTNTATSLSQYFPCSGVQPTNGCKVVTNLPPGSAATNFCQGKGGLNMSWSIQARTVGGAIADNPDLDQKVNIPAANCADYNIESLATLDDAFSGTLTVNAEASTGAAAWFRGFEYLGGGLPQTLDDILADSDLKWDILLVGPFNLNSANCTALIIPFTTKTGHTNLYFVVDTIAKSIPFTVTCPTNTLTFGCTDPVVYPPVQVTGGCGDITVTYDPATNALPNGQTTVMVTATDQAGESAQCSFVAIRNALSFDGFFSPIGGLGGSCTKPLRTINLGSVVPVKFDTSCLGQNFLGGQPTITITKCSSSNPPVTGPFQIVANEWHFNWDTSNLGSQGKGVYHLVATLQDGNQPEVYVQLK
jgi:hypothetical protein